MPFTKSDWEEMAEVDGGAVNTWPATGASAGVPEGAAAGFEAGAF